MSFQAIMKTMQTKHFWFPKLSCFSAV